MKGIVFNRIMALLCAAILWVSIFPSGIAHAAEKPEIPKIKVKVVNDTDIKVTIGKTIGADGYEVWITSDCGYAGYKNCNWNYYYNYNDNCGNYINATSVEKDGTAIRTVMIKNVSKESISIKVRAYTGTHYTDPSETLITLYGEFCKAKTVKVTPLKKGYKSSYNFSKVKKGDTIKFGTYEQDYPVNGKDPIKWVVLDKTQNGILVMSKYGLDCLPYNIERAKTTWENCTLRRWLNDKFYNAAFNKIEKSMIIKMPVRNNENPFWGTDGGNETKDKVFLLSIDDITKENYGFDKDKNALDINRRCAPTKYAVAQGAYQVGDFDSDYITADNEGACWWFLRSPGASSSPGGYSESAAGIYYSGYVYDLGFYVDDSYVSVRPVLFLKLNSD